MDPLTLLLTSGPSILRGIGSLFGGGTKDVADKVADVADAIQGKSPQAQRQAMQEVIDSLPPEAMIELKKIANEAERIKNEARARELEHDEVMRSEIQKTARVEAQSIDEYVRRTRPMLARQSFYAGTTYALIATIAHWFEYGDGVVEWVLAVLYSPCLEYIGARTIDKVKGKQ